MSSCRWIKISQKLELCIHLGSCTRNDYHSKSVHKSEARFCWHVRVQLWSSSFSASEKKDQMLNDCPIKVDHPHVKRGTSRQAILPAGLKEVVIGMGCHGCADGCGVSNKMP